MRMRSSAVWYLAVVGLSAFVVITDDLKGAVSEGDCLDRVTLKSSTQTKTAQCPTNPTQACRDTVTCYELVAGTVWAKYTAVRAYDSCTGETGTCKYCPPKDPGTGNQTQFVCAHGNKWGNNACNMNNMGVTNKAIFGPDNICPAN